jgi:hypothetical protein
MRARLSATVVTLFVSLLASSSPAVADPIVFTSRVAFDAALSEPVGPVQPVDFTDPVITGDPTKFIVTFTFDSLVQMSGDILVRPPVFGMFPFVAMTFLEPVLAFGFDVTPTPVGLCPSFPLPCPAPVAQIAFFGEAYTFTSPGFLGILLDEILPANSVVPLFPQFLTEPLPGQTVSQSAFRMSDLTVQTVPEPATWALLVGGATFTLLFRKRWS